MKNVIRLLALIDVLVCSIFFTVGTLRIILGMNAQIDWYILMAFYLVGNVLDDALKGGK